MLAEYERAPFSEPFAVQLLHRLRDQDPGITPALTWLDGRLTERNMTVDMVVREVHRQQGAANVTVRNIITSLRLISDVDWKELFEQVSRVDSVLAEGTAFRDMDFPTRNLYRSAVEQLARGSDRSEIDVACCAVLAATRAQAATCSAPADTRRGDPGYYLLAGGRREFETSIGFRPPLPQRLARLNGAAGIGGYAAATAIVTVLLLALPLLLLAKGGLGAAYLGLLAALGVIPAFDAAIALINRAVSFGFGPAPLPAWELREGVPAGLRTLIAVPTLLTTPDAIKQQIERLEIHHLASPNGDLHFALVSDWLDAATEQAEGDQTLLATAAEQIAELNRRYGPAPGGVRFLLLHRRRIWNEGEGKWIGWERKRGKLHELNRLLRGATDTTFMNVAGMPPLPPADIRYVITLDADTRLPRDSVHRLIGKMAHPLNRPRFDAATGRVVEGHAVLQPRIRPSLPVGREGSMFQRIFSSPSGIDPYASAVSDVYQDLFGEGSYAGKGIYDVDAFEAALGGRVPDSTLLSHDLFEGVFARAGLATDVEVVDAFPARYDVAALRQHRWARGDWQLLPWIIGRGATQAGADRGLAAIPAIGRWKMLDNLRRTLSAPACVLALLVGWAMPFQAAVVWTIFVLATIALPSFIPVAGAILPHRPGVTVASHLRALGGDLRLAFTLSGLNVILLAHQAWLMGDAILRTLWRLSWSHRHLLEWVTAAQATIDRPLDLVGFYRRMAGALGIGAAAVFVAWLAGHGIWLLVAPFAALWLASPAVARWISLSPRAAGRVVMSDDDARTLRLNARRTWRFFETFVTPADRMLPPDNFQEEPAPALARRTSPTNIGLYLLSLVSAHDFGWIGTSEATERLEATFATLGEMARFRGHFFNWYDNRRSAPARSPIRLHRR